MPIRSAARALIIEDQRVLVTRHVGGGEEWYILPGGGQEVGETLAECCEREVFEEIGARVEVGRLCALREIIAARLERTNLRPDFQQNEHVFEARLIDRPVEGSGHNPDPGQTGWQWMEISRLMEITFFPRSFVPVLLEHGTIPGCLYTGHSD